MPQSSDELAQEAAARRHRLERRAVELRERVDRDAESATQAIRRDLSTHWGSDTKVAQHPNVLLAGSFVAGTTLGLVSGGGGDDNGSDRRNGHSQGSMKQRHRSAGLLAMALGPLQAQAASLAREAAEDLFTETRRAIKGGISDMKRGSREQPSRPAPQPGTQPATYR
jgi:hypothetical protein